MKNRAVAVAAAGGGWRVEDCSSSSSLTTFTLHGALEHKDPKAVHMAAVAG